MRVSILLNLIDAFLYQQCHLQYIVALQYTVARQKHLKIGKNSRQNGEI